MSELQPVLDRLRDAERRVFVAEGRIDEALEWAVERLGIIDANAPDWDGGYCCALEAMIKILSGSTKGEEQ